MPDLSSLESVLIFVAESACSGVRWLEPATVALPVPPFRWVWEPTAHQVSAFRAQPVCSLAVARPEQRLFSLALQVSLAGLMPYLELYHQRVEMLRNRQHLFPISGEA